MSTIKFLNLFEGAIDGLILFLSTWSLYLDRKTIVKGVTWESCCKARLFKYWVEKMY
jgi:hypothetical protein